ncbi:hypothetical protein DTO271D3_1148 [Paecilomyces variotii]|nr:hypothetical protein DTO032I3_5189 [Paecilomyces variotii]KAJ9274568.1 hypothetical protein DTO021D3_8585 [Paecilomyces variotii]KAJ9283824.1 hypothetical protein DTO021C3_8581 [Paecilomyces variotii]KAJ9318486.1 hypothetical protein DTO271D3_1148 [Paecilomyces variotii]KAJ9342300.1 hypothetical protein DTO027B6_5229 [Paecilomyces variotii]
MGHFETDAKSRELQGIWENINECRNAITLNHVLHRNFGKFRIALDPTETEIEYNVLKFRATSFAKLFISSNNEVIFTQHEPRYAMPSPELLRIHAIIAKVLHASGQAEYIDKILQDRDNMGVLATDGSSNSPHAIEHFLDKPRRRASFGIFRIDISNWGLEDLHSLRDCLINFLRYIEGVIDGKEASTNIGNFYRCLNFP